MKNGIRIRYRFALGTMEQPDSTWFSGKVEAGDTGVYLGVHPNRKLKGWLLTRADSGAYVPVTKNQIEIAA